MRLTQGFMDQNGSNCGEESPQKGKQPSNKPNIDVKDVIQVRRAQLMQSARQVFEKADQFISRCPNGKQFAIGSLSGWTTGYLSTKVGKTVAISVGGSVLLIVAANQAGIVNINWEKFGQKVQDVGSKMEAKIPAIQQNVGRYSRTNTYFMAGFVGGFLLGLAS